MAHLPPERKHYCDSRRIHGALSDILTRNGAFDGDAIYAYAEVSGQSISFSTYLTSLQLESDTSKTSHEQALHEGRAAISVQSIGQKCLKALTVLQPHLLRENTLAHSMYGSLRDSTPSGAFTVIGEVAGYAGHTHVERPLRHPLIMHLMDID